MSQNVHLPMAVKVVELAAASPVVEATAINSVVVKATVIEPVVVEATVVEPEKPVDDAEPKKPVAGPQASVRRWPAVTARDIRRLNEWEHRCASDTDILRRCDVEFTLTAGVVTEMLKDFDRPVYASFNGFTFRPPPIARRYTKAAGRRGDGPSVWVLRERD